MRPPSDVTPTPKHLSPAGKALYVHSRKLLKADRRWRPEYSPLLARYVGALERAEAAYTRIIAREKVEAGTGWTSFGDRRQLVQHPDVRTLREAERDAHTYAEALLLTPAEREKLEIVEPRAPSALSDAFG